MDSEVAADVFQATGERSVGAVVPVHHESSSVTCFHLRVGFSITGKHTLAEVSRWPIVAVVRNVGGQVS